MAERTRSGPKDTGPRTARSDIPDEVQQILDTLPDLVPPDAPPDVPALEEKLTELAKTIRIDPPGKLPPVKPGTEVKPSGKSLGLLPDPGKLPPIEGIPIEPTIAWSFKTPGPFGDRLLTRNVGFAADSLDTATVPSLFFNPRVVEAPRQDKHTRLIAVHVSLTLHMPLPSGGEAKSDEVMLPLPGAPQATTIPVEPVVIPTVLALFRHRNFAASRSGLKGFVLFVFDPDPTEGTGLSNVLSDAVAALPLDAADRLIEKFPGHVPELLSSVDQGVLRGKNLLQFLVEQVQAQHPNVRREVKKKIERLKTIGIPTGERGLDAGNAVSSLIFVSVRQRSVTCWSGKLGDRNDPYFTLRTGSAGYAIIEDLHRDIPSTLPEQDQLVIGKKPGAANTFGDAMSAIEFS